MRATEDDRVKALQLKEDNTRLQDVRSEITPLAFVAPDFPPLRL
jgi:hypothetical protein